MVLLVVLDLWLMVLMLSLINWVGGVFKDTEVWPSPVVEPVVEREVEEDSWEGRLVKLNLDK